MKECPACRRCFPDDINHCPQDGDATTPSLLGEPILDDRYQLEKRLGQGGMGVVFQAKHIFLKTAHAIKIILPDLVGNDPMLVTRFRQEALAAAAIRHQNIISVTDFGVVRGTMPFLVMEFVDGKSLHDILTREGAMPPERALDLISAIGAGVAAAHKQNIVHRDLKPLNIMVQNNMPVAEGVKILDFGLAKIKSGELLGSFIQAKTSGLMGSPFYMAPEQWSDEEPDGRADIYSLGIILYQMLAGDVPFKGSSIPSIMKKHLTLPPPSFQSVGVQVSPQIEAVVRYALEKEVDARIPSVAEFLKELRAAVDSSGATTPIRRDTGTLDPSKTIASTVAVTGPGQPVREQLNYSHAATDPKVGAITSLTQEEGAQQQSAAAEARRLEQERIAQSEAARRQTEEEARLKKEKEEREALERQQRAQLERVSRQASDLEERLARLATSVPPQVTMADAEATQVRQFTQPQPVWDHSPAMESRVTAQTQQPITGVITKTGIRPLVFLALAVVVVFLATGVIVGYLLWPSPSPATGTTGTGKSPTAPPTTQFKPELIEIPGGTFEMGRNDGPPQERPAHRVTVPTFYMDRTEVTNEQYEEFVRDMNYEAPSHWLRGKPLALQEKWPVVNVSPRDAEAFAQWRSKRDGVAYRLPTEEEWEYAARSGGEYKLYPWGDGWEDKNAVTKEAETKPVGSSPDGANRWGVVDLIGNVWEWTSSKASLYPGNRAGQISEATKEWVVARGGSYSSDPNDKQIPVSATYRDWFDPGLRHPNFGFRLVRPAQ